MKRLLFFIISFMNVITFAQQPVELPSWPDGALKKNNLPATLHVYPTGEKWLRDKAVFSEDPEPMLRIGKSYLNTEYVANTLDEGQEEKLVIQPKRVDCVTFVEYVLAQALGPSFTENLQNIRYRDGIIDGYPSRLHYTSDWIDNGVRHGFLKDITAENSTYTTKLNLWYMSSHPELYKQLANSPENVRRIAEHEKALTGKKVHVLPKNKLPDTGLPWIENGDIIAITTNLPGLDIAHVGIANYVDGNLHLLHASSSLGKVVISEKPLRHMLDNYKSWTGIRIVRMSHPKNNQL